MQLWISQLIAQYMWRGYLSLENIALKRFVEYESSVIEARLPVEVQENEERAEGNISRNIGRHTVDSLVIGVDEP